MSKQGSVNILVVEDDKGHAKLIEKNLRRASVPCEIRVFHDGKSAYDYIFHYAEKDDLHVPSPSLILLDLDIPVVDGYYLLERIKSEDKTKSIPVVVLTSVDDEVQVNRCYRLGCNLFITKPVGYAGFCDAIGKLGLFLTVVTLPDRE